MFTWNIRLRSWNQPNTYNNAMHVFFQSVINNLWTFFAEVGKTQQSVMYLTIKLQFLIPETAMSRERKMEERDHNVRPSWNDFPPPSHLSCVTFPSWGGTWAMSLFCKSRVESDDIGSKLSTSITWIYSSKRSKLRYISTAWRGVSNGWSIVLSRGVLTITAYTGRLRPKKAPFLGLRYIKG